MENEQDPGHVATSPLPETPNKEAPQSPVPPPYSPFTPTLSEANLAPSGAFSLPPSENSPHWDAQWLEAPQAPSVNLEDNPDAIALRAAISVLQTQRDQSLKDIRTLDAIKRDAKANPEAFVRRLSSDQSNTRTDSSMRQNPTQKGPEALSVTAFPAPQDVVRTPPIEWSKYHIVGEPLNQMHEQQRQQPGTPDEQTGSSRDRVIAAPYGPFSDKPPAQTRPN